MNKPPSLMIVEPFASGHRMNYVRLILREALRHGIALSVMTLEQSRSHPSYLRMEEEFGNQFTPHTLTVTPQLSKLFFSGKNAQVQLAYHLLFQRFFRLLPKAEHPDRVLMTYFNDCDKATALLGSPFGNVQWSGLLMRERFHHPKMGIIAPHEVEDRMKAVLFQRLLKTRLLKKMFTLDESLVKYTAKTAPNLLPKIAYAPEPVEMAGEVTRAQARLQFGIPADAFIVLVYGMMDERKRLEALIDAMQDSQLPQSLCLLVAGPQSEGIKTLLASPEAQKLAGRIFQQDAYIQKADEFAAFRAADAVWLGYRRHYTMSAVLIQSGAMGLPALSCQDGLIGWLTREYETGIVFDAEDGGAVRNALLEICNNAALRQRLGQNGSKLAKRYTPTTFAQTLLAGMFDTEIIEGRMGKGLS